MRVDHIGLEVSDFDRSRAFYEKALAPLGMKVIMEPAPKICGFGGEFPFFWIGDRSDERSTRTHVAFTARDRVMVDAFFVAALEAGGEDNGGPGLREIYHPDYYGAFVLDPDGNNIEAVCHKPG